MGTQQVFGYSKNDIESAEKMLRLHLEKLSKHITCNEWPLACSVLRAIEGECTHANRIAASLNFQASVKRT